MTRQCPPRYHWPARHEIPGIIEKRLNGDRSQIGSFIEKKEALEHIDLVETKFDELQDVHDSLNQGRAVGDLPCLRL